MPILKHILPVLAVSLLLPAAVAKPPKPDLADMVQGEYEGDVISDARGSSQSGVDITIVKIAKNTVSVNADYDRIPPRTFRLTRAMDTIQSASGDEVFLLELQKSPPQLTLTIDDASWSGIKTGEIEPPLEQ